MVDDSVTTKQTRPGGSDGSDRTGNKSMKKYNYNNSNRRSTNLTATSGIYSDGSDSEGITTNIWSRLLSRSTSSASDYKNKSYRDEGSIDSFDNDEESNVRRKNSSSRPTTKSVLPSGCMRIKSTFQISALLSTLRHHP
jgi:hypothetical protein